MTTRSEQDRVTKQCFLLRAGTNMPRKWGYNQIAYHASLKLRELWGEADGDTLTEMQARAMYSTALVLQQARDDGVLQSLYPKERTAKAREKARCTDMMTIYTTLEDRYKSCDHHNKISLYCTYQRLKLGLEMAEAESACGEQLERLGKLQDLEKKYVAPASSFKRNDGTEPAWEKEWAFRQYAHVRSTRVKWQRKLCAHQYSKDKAWTEHLEIYEERKKYLVRLDLKLHRNTIQSAVQLGKLATEQSWPGLTDERLDLVIGYLTEAKDDNLDEKYTKNKISPCLETLEWRKRRRRLTRFLFLPLIFAGAALTIRHMYRSTGEY